MEGKRAEIVGRGLLLTVCGKPRDVGFVTDLPFETEKIGLLIGKLSVGFIMELDPIGKKESGDNATVSIIPKTVCVGENCDTGTVGMDSPGREVGLLLPNS